MLSKEKTADLPAPIDSAGLPAELADEMLKDAGRGLSTAQEDNIVPLIYILQSGSPQAKPKDPEYIEGAEAGFIWLRNAQQPLVDGQTGILFQLCSVSKSLNEWRPRNSGGGFVGRHDDMPEDARQVEDPQNPNRLRWLRRNGNEIMDTWSHAGFVLKADGGALPYIIPMSSTGISVSRQWMTLMNSKFLPGTSKTAPIWAGLYRLRTKERSNPAGSWYTWSVQDAGWVRTTDEYNRGKALHEAFAKGEKVAEAPIDGRAKGDDDEIPF